MVGTQNFRDPNVVVMLIVGAPLMLVVLTLVGGELGERVDPRQYGMLLQTENAPTGLAE